MCQNLYIIIDDYRYISLIPKFGPLSGSRSPPKPPNRRCAGRTVAVWMIETAIFRRWRPLTWFRSRRVRRTDDEGRSRQGCGKDRRGCEGFTTRSAEAGVARKSQAAKVEGPRAQR